MDLNTINNTFITKFNINENVLYIKLFWKENEHDLFHIKILEDKQSWSGRFSIKTAQEYYTDEVFQSKEEYYKNVKDGLTSNNEKFAYDFKTCGDTGKFVWKMKTEDGIKIVHGTVDLNRDVDPESKDMLIDQLLSENNGLQTTIAQFSKVNQTLQDDLEKSKTELEKFIDMKNALESTLYGKFVQLLNTKKKRIKVLEDTIQKFENS